MQKGPHSNLKNQTEGVEYIQSLTGRLKDNWEALTVR